MKIQPCDLKLGMQGYQENENKLQGIVVMLHGYGSSGDDIMSIAPTLATSLPNYYFFAPHAIKEYEGQEGYKWFDIDFSSYQNKNISLKEGLKNCVDPTCQIIRKKIQDVKKNYDLTKNFKINIIGFSQGAMISLKIACHGYIQINKVVSFGGVWVETENTSQYQTNKSVKILLSHGEEDDIIPAFHSIKSEIKLKELGMAHVEKIIFPNLSHSIHYEAAEHASKFLAQ